MRERTFGTEPAEGRARAARRGVCAVALAALAAGVANARPAPQDGSIDEFRPRAFQLYDTPAARARAEEAEGHVNAGRWSEALTELQTLIEEHRGEVLSAGRPMADGARYPSQSDVHAGAGSWAVQKLFELPEAGRKLYRDRFGRLADSALDRAIAAADRGSLARVAQRWPLTVAAERAWWALGDLEVELGHSGDGLRAWARAAALRLDDPNRTTTTEADWRTLRDALAALDEPAIGALARV
ncbi:MAG: hypothetical protein AAGA20_18545, partial [Planctomycetota bacterium]